MREPNFTKLEQNVIDMIKEAQAKLGFSRETVSLYYPLSSLNHLLDTEADAEAMDECLARFSRFAQDRLGPVAADRQGNMYAITLAPQAAQYARDHTAPNEFIAELVKLLARPGVTMDDVTALFHNQPFPVSVTPIANTPEFDTLVRFTSGPDPFCYCFRDEGFHITYHRFLPEDFEDMEG